MHGALVVFDLDGTLVDSSGDLAAAASRMAVEFGGRSLSQSEVIAMVGDGAAMLVRRALTAAGVDPETPEALPRFLALYDACLLDTTRLYPGVLGALESLEPTATLAVLTNKPGHPATRLIDALGVGHYFVEIVGGDGPWPRKPDPAGLVALRTHCPGGPVVMVGDSPVDAETAARAGAAFVLAGYGFGAAAFGERTPTPFVALTPGALPAAIADACRSATLGA